jgi:hypothetical protein
MDKQTFKQAFRELRADGRIGYTKLSPRARFAAIECLRMRLEGDELAAVRSRLVWAAIDRGSDWGVTRHEI